MPKGPQGQIGYVMLNNRNLRNLCVWFGIVLLGIVAWWATETAWAAAFVVVAGVVTFYFVNRRDQISHAKRS